ncbi:hypothetical protein BDDG_12433 [Blastomyces dermatitidis ATCC 18188]|uniref:Uncharacterized protein n=1 Tax=Ajellomyces dermatitidis (strain ATCC 18188 / CBS 674.68) TaxID=653446 RepID=A0A0J9HFQ0_AJEDA|nr:hypothetical protein BDDG_12433 [Blastomyces dermatitidis ATCC 18188]
MNCKSFLEEEEEAEEDMHQAMEKGERRALQPYVRVTLPEAAAAAAGVRAEKKRPGTMRILRFSIYSPSLFLFRLQFNIPNRRVLIVNARPPSPTSPSRNNNKSVPTVFQT